MEEGMSAFCIQPRSSSAERKGTSGTGTGTGTGTKCGRWNPTTEQVKVLTDLFRAGLRTPSTEQIQKISTQLSFYGKIESKNVFYWFQNHKARERQKRRRVSTKDINIIDSSPSSFQLHHLHNQPPATPIKYLGERNDNQDAAGEGEREIETLELFPMKESEKLSLWMLSRSSECKENNDNNHLHHHAAFSYTNNLGRELIDNYHYPPLDLRLSFF